MTSSIDRTSTGRAAEDRAAVGPPAVDPSALDRAIDGMSEGVTELRDQVHEMVVEFKPRLRGWLHAATAPLTLAAGIVLIALSPTVGTRIGSTVFAVSAMVLFTVSATMHRGHWSPRANAILTRLDHSCIFLLIAGSYTPFALLLLAGQPRTLLLCLAWGGAAAGIMFRTLWPTAPRWVYTPIYMALGWACVFFAHDFIRNGSVGVVSLLVAGGLLYTLGAVVYGLRRPNPVPAWFGFHEVFHALTIAAFTTHYIGVSIATYALR